MHSFEVHLNESACRIKVRLVLYVWVPQNDIFYIRQILLGSRAILGSSCELSPEPVSELPGDK